MSFCVSGILGLAALAYMTVCRLLARRIRPSESSICIDCRLSLSDCRQYRHRRRQDEVDPGPHVDADPPLLHLNADVGWR